MMGAERENWEADDKVAAAFAAKYPKLFIKRGKPMSSMNGGLGLGKGWYGLFEEACQLLESYRDRCPEIHLLQVKEKFARLTVYVGFVDASTELCREIYDALQVICNKSEQTCEICGSTNNVSKGTPNGYWLRTLCESCHKEKSNQPGKMADFEAARKLLESLKEKEA